MLRYWQTARAAARTLCSKGKGLLPRANLWQRGLAALGLLTLLILAFCWGRYGLYGKAHAQLPGANTNGGMPPDGDSSDYPARVVAYIYKDIPVTREDLGEYLIARFGKQRLEFLVNRRIIEIACRGKGIVVTDLEVEQQFNSELKAIGPYVTAADFERTVLSRFNKTLYEWKEDVIRPKIAMTRFCRDRVIVSPEDLTKAFEARFGPKVRCRMIVLDKDNQQKYDIQQEASKSDEAFKTYAKNGVVPAIAAQGGEVPPIHKHFGDASVEREAFSLQVGEVSQLLQMPDKTWVILRCDERIPPDTTTTIEQQRERLHAEVFERKLQEAIPKVFQELRQQANPLFLLREAPKTAFSPRELGLIKAN